jgi:hypothetical protein
VISDVQQDDAESAVKQLAKKSAESIADKFLYAIDLRLRYFGVDHFWSQNVHARTCTPCMYIHFAGGTSSAVLFREMVSINYLNLIRIVRSEKMALLCFGAHLKGSPFWR